MNAETFAEWLRRQGHTVYHTSSSYWYNAGPRVLQAFPYHWIIQPSEAETVDILRSHRLAALRYSAPVQSHAGVISYHVVYEASDYTIDGLDRRSRQNVRNGLKKCHVEAITLEFLADEGWRLELDTDDRQGRNNAANLENWRRRILSAVGLPGFEAWGAFVENELAASLLSFQMDDCCELISQQCDRRFLSDRVNNALTFSVTQLMVNRPDIQSIFYTMQSLDAPESVDEFKFRMGYQVKPVRQRVVFHPWLIPAIGEKSLGFVDRIARWFPNDTRLPKVKGILRYYLDGQRPICDQNIPQCVMELQPFVREMN